MSRNQVTVENNRRAICSFEDSVTARDVRTKVTELTGMRPTEFYLIHNGHIFTDDDICDYGKIDIILRTLGGKGGFGSMLRAIGAQIEKTTNREACRDLSGRRLRDINEEKRLKSWIDKQATREEQAVERKKRKLERLCAQPKHEFKDKNYEKERSTLTEKVGDAVEEGFKIAMAGGSGVKRKSEEQRSGSKKKLAIGLDIDSDELGSSDDSESEFNSSSSNDEKTVSDPKEGDRNSQDIQGVREDSTSTTVDEQTSADSETSVNSSSGEEAPQITSREVQKVAATS
ncbi:replication stress response regulator SDE2 [Athalia rosae]|uniref:replication stress response regulator SDE2 n=1 Tax=Athalia rosae TaxID=37344 RepID=UPI00203492EA|nr:replication stress response regulator SDE2 [Athalia rosae]